MQTSNHYLRVFFILFSFSILFISCSQESDITSPNERQTTSMAKTALVPTAFINHSTDTLITFPKSGKKLIVSKNYSTNQLAQIDSFLTTHNIKTKTAGLTPLLQNCSDRTFYNWEVILPYVYQTAPGKYLGIWCDYLTPTQCKNYGFNELFISGDNASINSAINSATGPGGAGFSVSNLMVNLGSSNSAIARSIITGTTKVGYYYIDEPFERQAFGDSIITIIPSLANLISTNNSTAKLLFSSWFLPYTSICKVNGSFPGGTNFDAGIENLFGLSSNIDVMCDEYYSNCCAYTSSYWDSFKNSYGARNISNWMHIVINNGNTGFYKDLCSLGLHSSDWSSLFGKANAYGMNNIWLYAYQTGNEAAVSNFALAAFQNGYVYNEFQQVVTEWKCVQNNCTTCSYPSGGTWYLYDMYYTHVYTYFGF